MTIFLVCLGILLLAAIYYFITAAKKPSLIYQETALNKAIVENTGALKKRYYATPWLFNTHLQLIVLGFIKGFASGIVSGLADYF